MPANETYTIYGNTPRYEEIARLLAEHGMLVDAGSGCFLQTTWEGLQLLQQQGFFLRETWGGH